MLGNGKISLLHLIPCLTFPLPSLLHVFCSLFFTLARLSVRLSNISYPSSPILKEHFRQTINHENKIYTTVKMYIYYDTQWASPRIWSGQLNVQSSSRLRIKSNSLEYKQLQKSTSADMPPQEICYLLKSEDSKPTWNTPAKVDWIPLKF